MCRRYYQGYCLDKYGNGTPTTCGGDMFKCKEPKITSKQGSTTGGITMDEVLKKIQGGTKMAEQTKCTGSSEWYAKQIRDIGEMLLKHADSMAVEIPGRCGIDIWVSINPMEQTEFKVETRIRPEIGLGRK